MTRRGSVSVSAAVVVFSLAACGGRTGALGEDYEDPEGQGTSGATGTGGSGTGARPTGGRPGQGGTSAGSPTGIAGGPMVGGAPYGGYGGYGAGYPGGYGGTYPVAGYGGTFGTAGGLPVGGFGGQSGNCQSCLFQTCSGELTQCFLDFGCVAILGCVQATGCDTFQCYSRKTCGDVIDQYGGPAGPSMSYLLTVLNCSVQSGCPCN